ncbi:allantoate amidohydrolase [Entomobacter blattae]|uniref:N-carbamoyl-L-amino-acid hydrolase n=1 Tax=Entomobacter blattae TaxID=2762277 RepID=A0A7H1NU77_9PROT|nr:allantoate amidohydrolase [Entomobacter blattae]QNT79337.1 N-carbamoyl-L-amino-acid hydrolase [Entomobacter blattae]
MDIVTQKAIFPQNTYELAERIVQRCNILAHYPFSDLKEELYRPYLGVGYRQSITQISEWMKEDGIACSLDKIGNLTARYDSQPNQKNTLLIGSHIDSVKNGGAFDGMLGVMLGLELLAFCKRSALSLPFALEVIGFGDEEGSRFPLGMLTSRLLSGHINTLPAHLADHDGITLEQAFTETGLCFSEAHKSIRSSEGLLGYLEVHIEQGPVLQNQNLPTGIVQAIAAQRRYEISLQGLAGHAGTVPMSLRKDALSCAAAMILQIEEEARASSSHAVATTGMINVAPNAANVIAGTVMFTLDIRAPTTEERDLLCTDILEQCQSIAQRRGIEFQANLKHDLPAVQCDVTLKALLETASKACNVPPFYLMSGAGHDAMNMARITPSAMLFTRCLDGISHNPLEDVSIDDVEKAVQITLTFIKLFAESYA